MHKSIADIDWETVSYAVKLIENLRHINLLAIRSSVD